MYPDKIESAASEEVSTLPPPPPPPPSPFPRENKNKSSPSEITLSLSLSLVVVSARFKSIGSSFVFQTSDEFATMRKFKITEGQEEVSMERAKANEDVDIAKGSESEILKIFQALLLSVCMLLLSYHSVRYGRTEYSILESGEITEGYAHKAVVTLSLGYSTPYAIVSFMAIGMLAYSLVSVREIRDTTNYKKIIYYHGQNLYNG